MIYAFFIAVLLGTTPIQELVDTQQWDQVESRLESLSPAVRPRFEGLIAQGRGEHEKAAEAFERALIATPEVPQLNLYAAHAYLGLKRFEKALEHARAAKALREESIAQSLLEARALDGLDRAAEAYSVLVDACQLFQEETRPRLELAALAHRKGLKKEVRRLVGEVLERTPDRDTALALFHLLYGDAEAGPLLEQMLAQYQGDAEIRAHFGYVYAEKRRWFSAARLFEEAMTLGGDYAFEAADQYWLAGRYRDALRLNGLAPRTDAQQVQRISILFEQRSYARIVAINPTQADPATRYRLAYSHYSVGSFSRATDTARGLLGTGYDGAAKSLLKAMGRSQVETPSR